MLISFYTQTFNLTKRFSFMALLLPITRNKNVHQYYNNSIIFIYIYVHSNQQCDDFTFCNILWSSLVYRCVSVRTSGIVLTVTAGERN
jgi:hypothetical protein